MVSVQRQIKELQATIDDIIAGYYTQPTSLGPNTLSKNAIKARSINSGNINVSNLSSVQTKTGSLSVDGDLTIGTGGSLRSGKTSYSDTSNAGFWMGIDSSVTKIRVGNIGHTSGWTWDGTALSITGSITATTGTIGGWTISSSDLTSTSGSVGMASSGSIRFWSGNSTPASAPFQVSSAGALTSTSGSIGGWTIDASGIRLGSGSTARGMDSGSTAFYAGSATPSSAPFHVSTNGDVSCSNLTVTGGTITANALTTGTLNFGSSGTFNTTGSVTGTIGNSSGTLNLGKLTVTGQISLGSGGSIVDADGSVWNQNGITLVSSGTFGDTIKWQVSGSDKGSIFADSSGLYIYSTSGSSTIGRLALTGTTFELSDGGQNRGFSWDGTSVKMYQGNGYIGAGGSGWVSSGRLYPNDAGSSQTTRYISDNGTRLVISGNVDFPTITASNPGNTNWSSRNFSADGGGYITIYISGTAYRIPSYANA